MATTSSTSSTSAADIFSAINGASGTKTTTKTATQDMEDRFMTLLMTQLQNQDPLNPLDNAQVTSQLSQINTVKGIENLNTTLTKLLSAYNDTQSMQSASLIGKGVLVAGNTLSLSSGLAAGGFTLDAAADSVVVKVTDAAGNVVQTQNLGSRDAGTFNFTWDGKDSSGTTLADGNYKFTVTAGKNNGTTVKAQALQLGTVSALVRTSTGFVLDLGSLGRVDFDSVQQII